MTSQSPHGVAPAQSGVYRTPVHVDPLRQSLAKDALWIEVDVARVGSKADLMDIVAAAVQVPAGFGRNWDALADVLQDLSWRPAPAYVLRFAHAAAAARALGGDWATLIEVLRHTAEYWKARGKPFIVFADDAAELVPWI